MVFRVDFLLIVVILLGLFIFLGYFEFFLEFVWIIAEISWCNRFLHIHLREPSPALTIKIVRILLVTIPSIVFSEPFVDIEILDLLLADLFIKFVVVFVLVLILAFFLFLVLLEFFIREFLIIELIVLILGLLGIFLLLFEGKAGFVVEFLVLL